MQFFKKTLLRSAVTLALCLLAGSTLPAQEIKGTPSLRVIIKKAEPFVILDQAEPTGYSIELWHEVAQLVGLSYKFSTTNSVEGLIDSLADKKSDVAVGALSITSQREAKIDFSHSIYNSGLGLVVRSEAGSGWLLDFLKQSRILYLAAFMVLGFLIAAHIIWIIHRNKETPHFPKGYFHGITEAMWWAGSVFLGGTCDDKKVEGLAGRLFTLVWVIVGLTFVSYLTATLTSVMTVSQISSQIHELGDLKGREIATVEKSEAAGFLATKGMTPLLCNDISSAIDALKAGKVKAVFYDIPILRYHISIHKDDGLIVLPTSYLRHQYGFGLEFKSPYTKQINEAILKLKENGKVEELRRKWFGDDSSIGY